MKKLLILIFLLASMGANAEKQRGCFFEPWTNKEIMDFEYQTAKFQMCLAIASIKTLKMDGIYASEKIDLCNVEKGKISLLLAAKFKEDLTASRHLSYCEMINEIK
jgi:hypothetical protein